MKKTYCIIAQSILLVWFLLDMTGFYVGDKCLVTMSYAEDGIFFLIYLLAIVLFVKKESIGKYFMIGWLSIWVTIQFICHEWYTIFNGGFMGTLEGKIKYFSETIQWMQIEGKYIPDVYHTILHILLLTSLVTTVIYAISPSKKRNPHFSS